MKNKNELQENLYTDSLLLLDHLHYDLLNITGSVKQRLGELQVSQAWRFHEHHCAFLTSPPPYFLVLLCTPHAAAAKQSKVAANTCWHIWLPWAYIEVNNVFAALDGRNLQSAIVCLITGSHPHEVAWLYWWCILFYIMKGANPIDAMCKGMIRDVTQTSTCASPAAACKADVFIGTCLWFQQPFCKWPYSTDPTASCIHPYIHPPHLGLKIYKTSQVHQNSPSREVSIPRNNINKTSLTQ